MGKSFKNKNADDLLNELELGNKPKVTATTKTGNTSKPAGGEYRNAGASELLNDLGIPEKKNSLPQSSDGSNEDESIQNTTPVGASPLDQPSEWQKHLDEVNNPTPQPAPASTKPVTKNPTPENIQFDRTKALDFIKQDYLANRDRLDPILTKQMPTLPELQTGMQSDVLPQQKPQAGTMPKDKWGMLDFSQMADPNYHPQGQKVQPWDMRVFQYITDASQGANVLKNYINTRNQILDDDLQKATEDLNKQFPAKVKWEGKVQKWVHDDEKGFAKAKADIAKKYNEQKAQLLQAVDLLSDEKVYNEAKESADDVKKYNGKFADATKMGERKREIMGREYDDAFGITALDKQKRYEMKGLPVDGRTKWINDQIGLDIAQRQVMKEAEDYWQKNPDTEDLPANLKNSLEQIKQQKAAMITKHGDFVRDQVASVISDQIFKDKNWMQTMTGAYTITKKDIQSAAKKLGLDEKYYKNVRPEDIKTENIFGSFINDLAVKPGANLGAMITRPFRKYVLGQDADAVDAHTDLVKQRFTTMFGEAPDAQAQFGTGSRIDINPESESFLQNVRGSRKFNWNPAAIANTIASGFAQLSTYGFGAGATGKLIQGTGKALNLGERANAAGQYIKGLDLVNDAEKARDAGLILYGFASQYDDNYQQARQMGIENEASANAFAFIRSLASAYTEKIFPDYKVTDALFGPTSTAGKKLISTLAKDGVKGLKQETVRDIVKKGIVETLKDTNKESIEEIADQIADVATTAMFKPEANKDRDVPRELWETYLTTAIGTLIPVGAGHIRLGKTDSRFTKNMLYHVGLNPDEYKKGIQDEVENRRITQAEADKKYTVINTLKKAVDTTPDISPVNSKPLSENDKVDYVHNVMKEGLLKDELNRVKGDDVQEKAINAEISQLQKERQSILERADGIDRNGHDEPLVEGQQEDMTRLEENRKADQEKIDEKISKLDKNDPNYDTRLASLEKEKQDTDEYYDNISSSKNQDNGQQQPTQQRQKSAEQSAEEGSDQQSAQQQQETVEQPAEESGNKQSAQQGKENGRSVLKDDEGEEDEPINPESALPSRFRKNQSRERTPAEVERITEKETKRLSDLKEIKQHGETYGDAIDNIQRKQDQLNKQASDKAKALAKQRGLTINDLSESEWRTIPEYNESKRLGTLIDHINGFLTGGEEDFNKKGLIDKAIAEQEKEIKDIPNKKVRVAQTKTNEKPDTVNANNSIEDNAPSTKQITDLVKEHGKLAPFMQKMMEAQPEQFINELKDQVRQGMQPGKENHTGAIESMYGKPAVDLIRQSLDAEKQYKFIGKNIHGQDLFEDQNGERYKRLGERKLYFPKTVSEKPETFKTKEEHENNQSTKEAQSSNKKSTGNSQATTESESSQPASSEEHSKRAEKSLAASENYLRTLRGEARQDTHVKDMVAKAMRLRSEFNQGKDYSATWAGVASLADKVEKHKEANFVKEHIIVAKPSHGATQNTGSKKDDIEKKRKEELAGIDITEETLRKPGTVIYPYGLDYPITVQSVSGNTVRGKNEQGGTTSVILNPETVENLIQSSKIKSGFYDKESAINKKYDAELAALSGTAQKQESPEIEKTKADLAAAKEELRKALLEARGKLSMNGVIDPKVVAAAVKTLSLYTKLGIQKFNVIMRDLIDTYGKDFFDKENVDAMKGVYSYYRSQLPREERKNLDSDDDVEDFIGSELPNILNNEEKQGSFESRSEAISDQAEAIITESEAATTNQQRSDAIEKIDTLVGDIDEQLKLAGVYEEGGDDKYETGTGYGKSNREKAFKKDLVKYSKELAKALGYEHDTDKKGRTEYATINVPPAGGNGSIILWKPNSDFGVYINYKVAPDHESPEGRLVFESSLGDGTHMWRVTTKQNKYTGLQNRWDKPMTVGEFAPIIKRAVDYAEKALAAQKESLASMEQEEEVDNEPFDNSFMEMSDEELLKAEEEMANDPELDIQLSDEDAEFIRKFNEEDQAKRQADADEILANVEPSEVFLPPPGGKKVLEKAAAFLSPKEAAQRLKQWKDEAKRIGKEEDRSNRVIISMFDYTGSWSQPYVDAGYTVLRFDIQHDENVLDYNDYEGVIEAIENGEQVLNIGGNLMENPVFPMREIVAALKKQGKTIDGVLSATPCTTFAGSGAQHWPDHDRADWNEVANRYGAWAADVFNTPNEYNVFLEKTTEEWIHHMQPEVFDVMENPVGRIAKMAGLPEPTLQFHPYMFGDPYTKRTQLWGKFNPNLPTAPVEATEGSKMQSKLNSKNKVERSTTPTGFAYSFFIANVPNALNNPNFNTDESVQQTTTTGTTAGQLRTNTETVSTGKSQRNVSEDAKGQNAEQVSSRPGGSISDTSERPDGTQSAEEPGRGNGVEHSYVNSGRSGENVKKNEALGGESGEGHVPKTGEATIVPDYNGRNFVIPPNFEHKKTFNPVQKLNDNIAAIETLYNILKEDRPATDEEKETLFKYVGFGGLKEVTYDPKADRYWVTENAAKMRPGVSKVYDLAIKLKDVGIEDALERIHSSILNAHYTAIPVIRGIYDAVEKIGFNGGKILEPSMGIGHFFGAMPSHISKKSDLFGVELDSITGNIAKILYPDARIEVAGLQDARVPKDYLDLVISNIPFGDYRVYDRDFDKSRNPALTKSQLKIHNYFFAKALESVRDGGIVAFITSNGVMDSPDNHFMREHMTKTAEFLGAIRLPDHAFKANANTQVVTDIIFLRKFQKGEQTKQKYDILNIVHDQIKHYDGKSMEDGRYNEYFKNHPEMVIGKIMAGNQYSRSGGTTVVSNATDMQTEIATRAGILFPEKVYKKAAHKTTDYEAVKQFAIEAAERRKPGNIIFTKQGMAKMVDANYAEPWKGSGFSKQTIEGFVAVRDNLNKVIAAELSGVTDESLSPLRKELNKSYDDYVKKNGLLSSVKNQKLLSHDIDGFNVGGLERYDDKQKKWVKADIFSKRTISPYQIITHAENINDALLAVLGETGGVDIDRMAELMGKTVDEVAELGKGLIYEEPSGGFVTADDYLSGPVRKKLAQAKLAAEINPKFQHNVEALEKVQPEDIKPVDIEARVGARWVGAQTYQQFANELFNTNDYRVTYDERRDKFTTDWRHETTEMRDTYGTRRIDGAKLFDLALQLKAPTIYDKHLDGSSTLNVEETAAAQEKWDVIREKFREWIWKDDSRRENLGRLYNDTFNDTVKRTYDGTHLTFPGFMYNQKIKELAQHQKDAIWMMLQNNGGIIDHIVGAGKTLIMVGAAMEMKRMGIAKKPMIIAMKANVSQIEKQFREVYPNAQILSVKKESDFSAKNRKKTLAQIANNDWDAIVITHDNYKGIPHDDKYSGAVIREELEMLEDDMAALEAEQGKAASKQQLAGMQKRKENLLAKLDKLSDIKKDKEMRTFQELGVDHLMVDESQEFKNLTYSTKLTKVAGLGPQAGSQKALNLLFGIRSLQDLHRGDKGVTFLSGTPISNTMVEMYLLLKYLRPRMLEEKGMKTFDSWVTTFAQNSRDVEFAVTGALSTKDRFREFLNVPELAMMYNEIADVRNDTNLKLPKPEFKKSITLSFDEEKTPSVLPEVGAVYQIGDGQLKIYNSQRLNETRVDVRGTWIKKPTGATEATTIHKVEGKGPDSMNIEGYSSNNYIIKNIKQSEQQQEYTRMLIEFARNQGRVYRSELGMPPLNDKNKKSFMINATTASSKMAIDVRLLDPSNGDTPGGKLDVAADTILEHYIETNEHKGTQLVFSDIGTPKGKESVPNLHQLLMEEYGVNDDDLALIFGEPNEETGKFSVPLKTVKERMEAILEYSPSRIEELIGEANDTERSFNVYAELKKKLMARGVPGNEIAFIHDYKTKTKKDGLFEDVKAGNIRVLIGSTRMMGTGVNVQDKLRAIHHIDAPWKPSDMEQRNGRGVRQGNKLAEEFFDNEVPVYAYATELTLDAYKYQLLSIKQAYIDQIKSGAIGERTFDEGDADGEGNMGFGEMMAITSGNPDILEQAKVNKVLKTLHTSRRNFEQERYDAHSKITRLNAVNSNLQEANTLMQKDLDTYRSHQKLDEDGEPVYSVELKGKEYNKAKEAGTALIELKKKAIDYARAVNEKNIVTKKGHTDYSLAKVIDTDLGTVNGLKIVYRTTGFFLQSDKLTIGNTGINITGALSDDATAAGTALNSIAKRLENVINNSQRDLQENNDRIKNLQELQNKTWPKEEEYQKLKARQKELDARIQRAASPNKGQENKDENGEAVDQQRLSDQPKLSVDEQQHVQALLAKAFPAVKTAFHTDQATFDQVAKENGITGNANAFVDKSGTIQFNPNTVYADTQLHEYGHILTRWAQKYAPSLYSEMLKHGRQADDVVRQLQAAGYDLNNTRMAEEAFVTLLGRIGANEAVEKSKAKRPNVLFEFVNNAWNRFSRWMAEKYGFDIKRMKSIDKMSLREFANMLNEKYLLSGTPISGQVQGDQTVAESRSADNYDLEPDQIMTADKIVNRLRKGADIVAELNKIEDAFQSVRSQLTDTKDIAELEESHKEFKRYLFDSILNAKVEKILGKVDLELDSQNFAEKAREAVRDRFRRLQQVQNKAQEHGIDINEDNDAFNWADRWRSVAAAKVDDVLKKVGLNQVDVFVWKGREKLKNSLFDRMSKDNMDLNQFGLYLYALHAPERNAHNAQQRRNQFEIKQAELQENLADIVDKLKDDPTNSALKAQRTKIEKELSLMDAYMTEYDKGPQRDQKLISVFESSLDKRLRLMDDGGSGMTNEQAQGIIDEVNNDPQKDKYEAYAKEVKDNIVSEILNKQLEYGMISQEDFDYLSTFYSNYVPLKVDDEFFDDGKTFAQSKIPGAKIFRSKGADYITFLNRVNPFTQSIIDLNATIYNGEQNNYRKKVAALAKDAADYKVWEVKSARYKPLTNKNGRLLTMQEINKPTKDEAIEYYDNGIKKYIFIHDQPLLKAINETNTSRAVPYLNKINGFLRAVNTVYNPEFTLSNLIRDLQTAGIVLSSQEKKAVIANFTKNALVLPSIIRGVWRDQSGEEIGKWTALAKEYRDLGGEMTWFKQDSANEQISDIEKYYEKYQKTGAAEFAKKAAMGMAIYMNKFNTSIENSTRLNIYKSMVDAGIDKNRAIQVARNATINFNRKGTAGPLMDSMYLFYNASVQGTANVFKALLFTKTGRMIAGGIIAMGYLQSMMNSILSDCSDTGNPADCYDNVKDYERDKYFVFKSPFGHGFVKIPLAYGYGFFYNLGERIHRAQTGKISAGEFAGQTLSSLMSNFNPVGSSETPWLQQLAPTAVDPLVQWSTNKDGLGRPIYQNYQYDKRPDSQKASPFDSKFSKGVADWLNTKTGGNSKIKGKVDVSPGTIDWLMETLTGGTGKFLGRSTTTITDAVDGNGFDTELRDIPFLNRFYSQPKRFYDKSRIYDAVDDSYNTILKNTAIKQVYDELDNMVRHGDIDKSKADRYKHTIEFNQFKLNNQDLFDMLEESKTKHFSVTEISNFERKITSKATAAGISAKTYHTWINELKRNSKKSHN